MRSIKLYHAKLFSTHVKFSKLQMLLFVEKLARKRQKLSFAPTGIMYERSFRNLEAASATVAEVALHR